MTHAQAGCVNAERISWMSDSRAAGRLPMPPQSGQAATIG